MLKPQVLVRDREIDQAIELIAKISFGGEYTVFSFQADYGFMFGIAKSQAEVDACFRNADLGLAKKAAIQAFLDSVKAP